MTIYRVLGGAHEQAGKVYEKGETIDSDMDLMSMFPNKFAKVHPDDLQEAESQPVKDEPEKPKQTDPKPPKKETSGSAKGDAAVSQALARGIEATKDFPFAVREGYEVFRRGSFFHCYEPAEEGQLPKLINEKGVRKDDVEKVLREYEEE